MRKNSFKCLLASVICSAIFLSVPAQAKLFKWKDENGQTHYGDHIPARYLNKERKELNEQGAVVKNVGRAKTPEEREEAKRLAKVAKQKEAEAEEQRKRDRVLIDTYTTERDLIIARDARIDAVNSQIQLSESILVIATEKLERTRKRIENIKARKKEVPKDVYAKLTREEQQLATNQKLANGQQSKLDAINTQFNGYIARFNELMAMKQGRRAAAEARRKSNQ